MTQEIALSKVMVRRAQEESQQNAEREIVYKNTIKKSAIDIFSNPELFKSKLKDAIEDYLKSIEWEFWRYDGRKRAEKLKTEILRSKTTRQFIPALKEAISIGNEDVDSLKTFIFNCINLNFCEKKLPFNFIQNRLEQILAEINGIIKLRQDKSLLCYAAFFSQASNFNRLPMDLVREIMITTYHSSCI